MIRVSCCLGQTDLGTPEEGSRSQGPPPCALSHSWTVKQQCLDLLAEGLWEELLDDQQPDVTVMDWYVLLPTGPP